MINFLIHFKKELLVLSVLPTASIILALYANFVTFAEVTSYKKDVVSPVSSSKKLDEEASKSATSGVLTKITPTPSAIPNISKVQPTVTQTATQGKPEPKRTVSVTTSTNKINFPNNKFGVHAFSNNDDMDLAAQLVNSNGGDWGWITLTMDIHERNSDRWNEVFTRLLDKHLIPIIQLSNNGKIPTENEMDEIAKFLGGLGWPTKIRPVTAFSEVNASEYWGGKLDPEGYARILNKLIDSAKAASPEFIIMNGAFNASARTGSSEIGCIKTDLGVDTCYLSEIEYLKRMDAAVPGIFKKLDGWAVHTYPHPSYRGKPTDTRVGAESDFEAGRNTIRSYQFELRLLATFGVSLPVFITETGWPHKEGKTTHTEWYDQGTVAEYYRQAFQDIFLPDGRVAAVTPFILKFDSYDNFAFISSTGEKYPQWNTILNFSKTAGAPPTNK